MNVTGWLFFASALGAALIFRQLPTRFKNGWLLAISLAYLCTWSWKYAFVLSVFCLINFALGLKVENSTASSRKWSTAGIVINILFLFVFKYNHFFLPALDAWLQRIGVMKSGVALQILLPVGLSFLVVQAISYLIDVSNKRMKAERNLVKFGVFTLYFPKLLSGPVERARLFLPRLESPLKLDRVLFERSLSLILIGLFRKLVLANPLFSMIPEGAFTTPQNYAGQNLALWLIAYAFALYNDFAGYTSIIRGISLWFGIELTNNFNLPYFSRNFTEFWNRWHISLSSWLRDYIFFPLSRSLMRRYPERNHIFNLVIPPMVTLFVSGMWHGVSWGLLVWGGLHGLYLVVERLPGLIRPVVPLDERPRWRQGLGIVLTFLFTLIAWVPFRMHLSVAFKYWQGLVHWVKPDFFLFKRYITGDAPFLSWSPLNLPNPIILIVLAFALWFDLLLVKKGNEQDLRSLKTWIQVVILLVLLITIMLSMFSNNTAPFVYQGF